MKTVEAIYQQARVIDLGFKMYPLGCWYLASTRENTAILKRSLHSSDGILWILLDDATPSLDLPMTIKLKFSTTL